MEEERMSLNWRQNSLINKKKCYKINMEYTWMTWRKESSKFANTFIKS